MTVFFFFFDSACTLGKGLHTDRTPVRGAECNHQTPLRGLSPNRPSPSNPPFDPWKELWKVGLRFYQPSGLWKLRIVYSLPERTISTGSNYRKCIPRQLECATECSLQTPINRTQAIRLLRIPILMSLKVSTLKPIC